MDIVALQHSNAALTQAVPAGQSAQNRELVQAVKAVNASESVGSQNELTFQVDRETRQMVIRIVNRETREVLQQVPSEQVLQMAAALRSGR